MRKSPALQIEEISGNQYPDLKTAQDAALPQLADSMLAVIRDLLERAVLINDHGKIIPACKTCQGYPCTCGVVSTETEV
jgi:hypothetical protein